MTDVNQEQEFPTNTTDNQTQTIRILGKVDGKTQVIREQEVEYQEYLLDFERFNRFHEKSDIKKFIQSKTSSKGKHKGNKGNIDFEEVEANQTVDLSGWSQAQNSVLVQVTHILFGIENISRKDIVAADFQKLMKIVKDKDIFKFEEQENEAKKNMENLGSSPNENTN